MLKATRVQNTFGFIYFMYMSILSSCIHMHHHRHTWNLGRSDEDVKSPGTGVVDDCAPQCEF